LLKLTKKGDSDNEFQKAVKVYKGVLKYPAALLLG
jgi:hypothetical protein